MSQGKITTEVTQNIATITFGHPASNSFPAALLKELEDAIHHISMDKTISVLVLQSEGERTFCAGASFDELAALDNLEDSITFFRGFAGVLNAMRSCTKLIIGKVQGKAVGGGVGLIAACDYVIATKEAAIKLSEFSVGIGPFVIAPAVERKTGKTALAQLTMTPKIWRSADWALQKGLYTEVLNTLPEVNEVVHQLATELGSYNPKAIRAMKHILWKGTDEWEELLNDNAEISGRLALSEYTKKAIAKFKGQ